VRNSLTIPVARNHREIVTGNAMMYLTVVVKLNSRKMLPTTPQNSETAFMAVILPKVSKDHRT
jgi:hypothetical protein